MMKMPKNLPIMAEWSNKLRVIEHPILDTLDVSDTITIYFDEKPIQALKGEMISAALVNAGIVSFRRTHKKGEPRGIFCAIGRCTDCMMIVDEVPNTRTCVTAVRDGMRVKTQNGLGGFAKEGEE